MAVLHNPRHERFAQELAKGKSATEAYEVAGYKGDRTAASRLSTNVNVQSRVAELQQRGAEKAAVTVESLVNELEEARTLAAKIEQPSAAVQATIGKARLLGLIVDKKEDVTPRRNRSEILSELAQLLERRGTEQGGGTLPGAGAGRSDDQAIPTVPGHGTA